MLLLLYLQCSSQPFYTPSGMYFECKRLSWYWITPTNFVPWIEYQWENEKKNVRWENSENQSCVVTYWEIGKNFALSRWHKRSKNREKKVCRLSWIRTKKVLYRVFLGMQDVYIFANWMEVLSLCIKVKAISP